MLKTYTMTSKIHKEISPRKVSIHYHLVDREGEERTVIAIAQLGWNKKVKTIQPIHHRETPLVAALSKASINNEISVDFSNFNKLNPRISADQSKFEANKLINKADRMPSFISLNHFSIDPYRIVKLFLIATAGFAAYLAV